MTDKPTGFYLNCYPEYVFEKYWNRFTIIISTDMVSYIKGGMQAKGIWKQDPETNI